MVDDEYKTIRYMKRGNIKLTAENSTPELRSRLDKIPAETNMVVKMRVNSPVYVLNALELNTENIRKIATTD